MFVDTPAEDLTSTVKISDESDGLFRVDGFITCGESGYSLNITYPVCCSVDYLGMVSPVFEASFHVTETFVKFLFLTTVPSCTNEFPKGYRIDLVGGMSAQGMQHCIARGFFPV